MLSHDWNSTDVVVQIGQEGAKDHYYASQLRYRPQKPVIGHNQCQSSKIDKRSLNFTFILTNVPFLAKNLNNPAKPMKKYNPARKKSCVRVMLHWREVVMTARRTEPLRRSRALRRLWATACRSLHERWGTLVIVETQQLQHLILNYRTYYKAWSWLLK